MSAPSVFLFKCPTAGRNCRGPAGRERSPCIFCQPWLHITPLVRCLWNAMQQDDRFALSRSKIMQRYAGKVSKTAGVMGHEGPTPAFTSILPGAPKPLRQTYPSTRRRSPICWRFAEWRRVDVVEDQTLGGKVALECRVLSRDLLALRNGVFVDNRRNLSFRSAGTPCHHAHRFTRNHQPSHI